MSPNHKMQTTPEQIDLSGVLERLQYKDKFDVQRAELTVEMYRRFLTMVQTNPAEIMVPNEDVDTAWHHHILDTQGYMRDCQALFGQYLHHNPNFYGTDAFFEACDKTQATYEKSFGMGQSFVGSKRNDITLSLKPAACGGMLKDDAELNFKPAACGGMLKDDTEFNLKPAACGGMLKDDTEFNLKPAACGGMLKDDTEFNLNPAACGGMLKDDAELNLKPAACGGMLKDDVELNLTSVLNGSELCDKVEKSGFFQALEILVADSAFKQYTDEKSMH